MKTFIVFFYIWDYGYEHCKEDDLAMQQESLSSESL